MGEPARDEGFFEPLEVIEDPVDIERVDLKEAEGIVCCGPFDPLADPEVNRPEFLYAKQKGLKLLCANPDIIVDRGDVREWCAGARARLYTEMGGESLYFGKPHPPIYDLAYRRLAALGKDMDPQAILAIGDGIGTDIRGAVGVGNPDVRPARPASAERLSRKGRDFPDLCDRTLALKENACFRCTRKV